MKIITSINISVERRKRLVAAALTLRVPVSEVLSALMARSRLHYDQFAATVWDTVDYQPDSFLTGEEYTIMHVRLDPLCYEFGVSERLVFKVSVSFIYRVMIDLFLDLLVKNGLKEPVNEMDNGTNYPNLDYSVLYIESKKHEIWKIKWEKRVKDVKNRLPTHKEMIKKRKIKNWKKK